VNLEAIETEKFHLLPSPAYTKTFINAYAEAIGIDSKIIFGAYEHYRRSLHVDREEEKDHGRNPIKGKRNRFLIWTVLLTSIAGAAMLAFFLEYGGGPDILRTESVKPAGQKTDAATVEVAKPVQTPVQTEPPPVAEPGKPVSPENRQTAEPG
jgi:cytoskeletal protein RodZ